MAAEKPIGMDGLIGVSITMDELMGTELSPETAAAIAAGRAEGTSRAYDADREEFGLSR